jgi:hypothetical protein
MKCCPNGHYFALHIYRPNRTVDDNTIEVPETDIPATPPTKRSRKKDRKNSSFEYY